MLSKLLVASAFYSGINAIDVQDRLNLNDSQIISKAPKSAHEFISHEERMQHKPKWEKENLKDGVWDSAHQRKSKKNHHPRVKTVASSEVCNYAVNRLKAGPPNVPKIIADGVAWKDSTFTGTDTIYWDNGATATKKSTYDTKLADTSSSGVEFKRWPEYYKTAKIFDSVDSPTYTEPRQGGAGTCYIIQAMSGVAEFSSLITPIFLTSTKNAAGIHAVRFFIRGKPWVVAIDDEMLFYNGVDSAGAKMLYFTSADTTNTAMWAPLLEKAWAKIKGNYITVDGGFLVEGVRALTGVPAFSYDANSVGSSKTGALTVAQAYALLKAGEDANYIMAAGTDGGGNDQVTNTCGIAQSHAYAILAAFEMKDASNVVHQMLLMRNPWGTTGYKAAWHKGDTAWTDALVAQVPLSIDPRTSATKGIFATSMTRFAGQSADGATSANDCFGDYSIAHNRAGYNTYWYDREGADNSDSKFYYTTVPAKSGDLYFSVESYPLSTIPTACHGGSYTFGGQTYTKETMPSVYFAMWKASKRDTYVAYHYYYAQFNKPILIAEADYNAGEQFMYHVEFFFVDSPIRDYTVMVYSKQKLEVNYGSASGPTNVLHMDGTKPSGFTNQQFWTMAHTTDPSPPAPVVPKPGADSTEENTSNLSDELFYNVYLVPPTNADSFNKALDQIWEEDPIMGIAYFVEHWPFLLVFW